MEKRLSYSVTLEAPGLLRSTVHDVVTLEEELYVGASIRIDDRAWTVKSIHPSKRLASDFHVVAGPAETAE